jgi:hypothetical protein
MRWLWSAPLIALMMGTAQADETKEKPVVLLKTIGSEGDQAQELDATLRDAVQDLGMRLPLGEPTQTASRDIDLIERAGVGDGTWVVSPHVEPQDGNTFLVRILAVAPRSKEIRTRVELVKAPDVAARGLVMLRDLFRAEPATTNPLPAPCPPAVAPVVPPPHSAGRAVLAINGTVFGGFLAYSLQRVNVQDEGFGDARVAIPLAALGASIGLGASLLVAEEWDITPAMAWYLSAGMWWGVASGLFFASGYDVGRSSPTSFNERFYVAIAGGSIGLSLATLGLWRKRVDEGGMLMTHSTAAVGLFVGGLFEVLAKGPDDPFARPPSTGWGYGAAFGLATGGVLATLIRVPPTRVLLTDLGAVLGGLAGAAAASPLIVGDLNADKTRGWAIATLGGAVLGTGAALYFTRNVKMPPVTSKYGSPYAGVIGSTPSPSGDVPAMGAGWRGTW